MRGKAYFATVVVAVAAAVLGVWGLSSNRERSRTTGKQVAITAALAETSPVPLSASATPRPVTLSPKRVAEIIEAARNKLVEEANGRWGVEGPRHQLRFDAAGCEYTSKLAAKSRARRENGWRISLRGLSRGDTVLWRAETEKTTVPEVKGNEARYRRGEVFERYVAKDAGVEQCFDLPGCPEGQGTLVVEAQVKTELAWCGASPAGLDFGREGKTLVRYGRATVVDAAGRRLTVLPNYDKETGSIRLAVAGDWLDTAVYPVTIDPLIGTPFQVSPDSDDAALTPPGDQDSPDVAVDPVSGKVLIAYVDHGTTPSTIKAVLLDGVGGTVLDHMTVSDTVGSSKLKPRVAESTYDLFLVVWEDYRSPSPKIYGRSVDVSTGDIEKRESQDFLIDGGASSNDQTNPDVAFGDDGTNARWCVVWEEDNGGYTEVHRRLLDGASWDHTPLTGAYPPSVLAAVAFEDLLTPAVAYDTVNNLWLTTFEHFNIKSDIDAIRLDQSNTAGPLFTVFSGTSPQMPALDFDPSAARFMVACKDVSDIHLIEVDAATNTADSTQTIVASTENFALPAVAYNGTDFVVVFEETTLNQSWYSTLGFDGTPDLTVPSAKTQITSSLNQEKTPRVAAGSFPFGAARQIVWAGPQGVQWDVGTRSLDMGGALGTEINPAMVIPGALDPAIASGGGIYLAVWSQDDPAGDKILALRLDESGLVLDSSPLLIADGPVLGENDWPQVTFDGTNFMVAWSRDATTSEVRVARVSPTGTVLDPPGGKIVVSFTGGLEVDGLAPGDVPGRVLVVFDRWSGGPSACDVRGVFVDAGTATALGPDFNIAGGPGKQGRAELSFAPGQGTFMIVYEDDSAGNSDAFFRRLGDDGTLLDAAPRPLAQGPEDEKIRGVAWCGTTDGFWCGFSKPSLTGEGSDTLFGMRIGADGTLIDAAPVPVADIPGGDIEGKIIFDGSVLLAVYESGFPPDDVLGARFLPDGGVLDIDLATGALAPFLIAAMPADEYCPTAMVGATGIMTLHVNDTENPSEIFGVGVSKTILPTAVLSASPTSLGVGGTVSFDGTGSTPGTGSITAYEFDFGDGAHQKGMSATASHVYSSPGIYTAVLSVRDSDKGLGRVKETIVVGGTAPLIGDSVLPDATFGIPYSYFLTVVGGTTPYSFTVASGTLPAGLGVDPRTGEITGTPAAASGTYSFAISVTDANGHTTTSGQLSITVASETTDFSPTDPDTGLLLEKARFVQRSGTTAAASAGTSLSRAVSLPSAGDDDLDLRGRLTAAGLPFTFAEYQGVEVTVVVGTLTIVLPLNEYAGFRTDKKATPYVRFAVNPKNGKFRLLVRKADLDTVLDALPVVDAEGRRLVKIGLSLTTPAGVSSGAAAALFNVKTGGDRTMYDYNFRRDELASGVFVLSRFKAKQVDDNHHVVRIDGRFNVGQALQPAENGTIRFSIGYRIFDIPAASFTVDEQRGIMRLNKGAVEGLKRLEFFAGSQRFRVETDLLQAHSDAAGNDSDADITAGTISGMYLENATADGEPILAYVLFFGVEIPLADGKTLKARVPARISRRKATDGRWGF